MRKHSRTYSVTLLVKHEGGDGPSGISMVPGLTTNLDGGTAPAVLILGPRNGASRHRHSEVDGSKEEVGITEVVDEGNDQPMVFLISLPG